MSMIKLRSFTAWKFFRFYDHWRGSFILSVLLGKSPLFLIMPLSRYSNLAVDAQCCHVHGIPCLKWLSPSFPIFLSPHPYWVECSEVRICSFPSAIAHFPDGKSLRWHRWRQRPSLSPLSWRTDTRNSARPVVAKQTRERERGWKGERERERERESTSLGGSVSRGRSASVCVVRVVDNRVGRDFAQAELYSWGSRSQISDQSPPSRDSTASHGTYPRSRRRASRVSDRVSERADGTSDDRLSGRVPRVRHRRSVRAHNSRLPRTSRWSFERRLHGGRATSYRSELRSSCA